MKKETIKAEILSAVSEEIDEWLSQQSQFTSGYDYETQYGKVARKINRIILEKSMGSLPASRNKKNSTPVLER